MNIQMLNGRFAYVYKNGGRPMYEASHMITGKELQCNTLDSEWQDLINKDKWWASGYTGSEKGRAKEIALINKIRSFGGHEVCMPHIEEDVDKLMSRGQLWYGDITRLMQGDPSQCHRNSCYLWEENIKEHEVAIATGYALSKDGMWRQHSWLMHRKHRSVEIIETTEIRVAYFGYVMTCDEAILFCEGNF